MTYEFVTKDLKSRDIAIKLLNHERLHHEDHSNFSCLSMGRNYQCSVVDSDSGSINFDAMVLKAKGHYKVICFIKKEINITKRCLL